MTLTRKAAVLFAAQLFACASAFADCAVPQSPKPVPDGSSASIDEMNAAKSALESFEKAVKSFQTCVEADTKSKIAELGDKIDAIKQVKQLADKRIGVFSEELQKQADSYTEQMRAWKLTNRQ